MEEEKTNTEKTNTENTGAENTGAESAAAETPATETATAETTTETATAPEPAPAAEETPAADAGGDDGGEKKRPVFLTILCILTFIGSGLGLLTSLLMVVGVGALMDMMGSYGLGGMLGGGVAYFGVAALMAAASLYGAIMMWKLKKTGFYIYTGANVIAAILPIVWLGGGFAFMSFLWPVVFIVLYGLNLKHLK